MRIEYNWRQLKEGIDKWTWAAQSVRLHCWQDAECHLYLSWALFYPPVHLTLDNNTPKWLIYNPERTTVQAETHLSWIHTIVLKRDIWRIPEESLHPFRSERSNARYIIKKTKGVLHPQGQFSVHGNSLFLKKKLNTHIFEFEYFHFCQKISIYRYLKYLGVHCIWYDIPTINRKQNQKQETRVQYKRIPYQFFTHLPI